MMLVPVILGVYGAGVLWQLAAVLNLRWSDDDSRVEGIFWRQARLSILSRRKDPLWDQSFHSLSSHASHKWFGGGEKCMDLLSVS